MTLDYYRIFYYVAYYKSFSKAAKILHNNQPNITRTMNNMENEFGCKLFIRSHNGVTLTPEGKQLFEHVAIAIEQLYEGENTLINNRSLESGHISIGVSELALHVFLLPKLERFHTLYPNVKLKLSNNTSHQAIDALQKGLVDVAIVTSPIHIQKPLYQETLLSFKETLIGGKQYQHFSNSTQSLKDLQTLPFIGLAETTSTHDYYAKYFYEHQLDMHIDLEVATADQILPLVKHNLGVGFYPTCLLPREEIYTIPLHEELPQRDILLVQDATHPTSIAIKKFIDSLKEQ